MLAVPAMILMGFAPLTSIAASQIFALSTSLSGSVGNYWHGALDLELGLRIGLGQLLGVGIGVAVAKRLDQGLLRRLVGGLAFVVGLYMAVSAVRHSLGL